jgi:hypothetical protein
MATRARFGRLPRQAPSLTSTIVSLAQQYQGQRDRNIEDAWKNGGQFEGKKVTDTSFLNHWQDRLKGVSADDPMHDYYQNLIHTYTFDIAESKMGLKYARSDVSDGEMAQFYTKWANKLPQDSEAYRHLMTQAAKFKAASTARGHASSAQAASLRYSNAQHDTYNKNEAPFDVATGLIARYAEQAGYLDSEDLKQPDYGWSKLTNATGENDPANFSALLTDLVNDPTISKFITTEIKKYDPTFSGNFNESTLTTLGNNARNGAAVRLNRAQKAGAKGDATDARKAMDRYSLAATITAVSLGRSGHESFVSQNEHYRAQMDAVIDQPGASPMEKQTAIRAYRDWLTGQGAKTLIDSLPKGSLDPMSPNFNVTATGILGRINNTVNAIDGKPTGQTLKDDLFGLSTNEAGASSDAVKLSTKTADNQFALDNVAAGTAIVVRTDGHGKLDPHGQSWETFDRNAPEVLGNDNLVPVSVPAHSSYMAPDGTTVGGGDGEVRYNVAVPVKVRVSQFQDPATGAYTGKVDPFPGMDDTVGKQVDITGPGGTVIPVYGTYVGGRMLWSTVDPFQSNPTERITRDADGTVVRNYTAAQTPAATVPAKGAKVPPKPLFDPQKFVNVGVLTTPTTKPNWDPQTDKQNAWDSPLAALANSSSESMKYVADMGDNAIKKAETEWYLTPSHWTPDMTQKYSQAIQNGVDPKTAQQSIIGAKSGELMATVQFNRTNGFTPEQQNASRATYARMGEMQDADKAGKSVDQFNADRARINDTGVRDDLIGKLNNWNVAQEQAKGTPAVMGRFAQQAQPGPSQLPKGWTATDLLGQPGMTLDAANDLAFRISKGAVGKAFNYAPTAPPGAAPGTLAYSFGAVPGQNPYAPKPGQLPKPNAGPVPPPATPVYGPPAPKPPPAPTGTHPGKEQDDQLPTYHPPSGPPYHPGMANKV